MDRLQEEREKDETQSTLCLRGRSVAARNVNARKSEGTCEHFVFSSVHFFGEK